MHLPRPGTTRLVTLAAALCVATTLTACSDDAADRADPSPAPTSSATDDPTPAPPPAPEPEPEPEPTNPCDLIDQADYDQLVQPANRPFLVETPQLSSSVEPYFECDVRVNGYALLSFGYSLTDGALERSLEEERVLEDVKSLTGIGEKAFYTGAAVFPTAYADLGEQTIRFTSATLDGPRAVLAEPLRLLAQKVEEAGGITVGPALDLGEGCPSATSSAVRRVIGDVAYARGGPDLHGVPQCSYRSSPGRRTILTMGTTYYDKDRFDEEQAGGVFAANGVDLGVDLDIEVTDPPPGRIEDVYVDLDGGVRVRTIYPTQRVYGSVSTGPIGLPEDLAGSRTTVRRLATYWQAAAEPAIKRYRPYSDGRQPQRD